MKKGEATFDELFAIYKLDAGPCENLTKRVDKRYYDCWNTEPADEDAADEDTTAPPLHAEEGGPQVEITGEHP